MRLWFEDVQSTIAFNVSDQENAIILGGLAGQTDGMTIKNSYYSGALTATNIEELRFGGIAGRLTDNSSAYDSFSAFTTNLNNVLLSEITAFSWNSSNSSRWSGFFWDVSSTGTDVCVLHPAFESDPGCIPINADGSMGNYFTDSSNPPFDKWDFSATGPWVFNNGSLPVLKRLSQDD